MIGQHRTFAATFLLALVSELVRAQGLTTEFIIEIENVVHYAADLSDITKFVRNPLAGIGKRLVEQAERR
jgi:hypothetical protein